ncbi:hypothetical protein K439DRAFT_1624948 [Ramaria rubella]|nr:hypothetical protein K439DRAFT_1624948 [Ramaria rubella]
MSFAYHLIYTQNRIQNLHKPAKLSKISTKETLDKDLHSSSADCNSDYDWEEGVDAISVKFQILESEGLVEWDEEDLEDDEEEAIAEIRNDAALLQFSKTLRDAHDAAAAVERKLNAGWKQKRHYTGNAVCTKQLWAAKHHEMRTIRKKVFITNWFGTRRAMKAKETINVSSDSPDATESSDEDPEPQIPSLPILAPPVPQSNVQTLAASNTSAESIRIIPLVGVAALLADLHDGTKENGTDKALVSLDWRDFPALHQAREKLTIKSKDKKLDVFFRSRITSMVGTLNLYLDPELSYSWREASLLAAKAAGCGVKHA